MNKDEPCSLIYVDSDGDTHKKTVPITTLKTDAFGLTFYDNELSMLLTVTWDKVKSFKVEAKVSEGMIERSRTNQAYYSDSRAPNSFNRTV